MDKIKFDQQYKLMLLGDTNAGKTEFLNCFMNTQDTFDYLSRIGVDVRSKTVNIDGFKITLKICNTAGQERFRAITHNFYRGMDGIILIFDIDNSSSFNQIENGFGIDYHEIKTNNNIEFILIGNKFKKNTKREVDKKKGEDFAKKNGLIYREVDCANRQEVEEAVFDLVRIIMKKNKLEKNK